MGRNLNPAPYFSPPWMLCKMCNTIHVSDTSEIIVILSAMLCISIFEYQILGSCVKSKNQSVRQMDESKLYTHLLQTLGISVVPYMRVLHTQGCEQNSTYHAVVCHSLLQEIYMCFEWSLNFKPAKSMGGRPCKFPRHDRTSQQEIVLW